MMTENQYHELSLYSRNSSFRHYYNLFLKSLYYFLAVVLTISGIAKILDPLPLIETLEVLSIEHDMIIVMVTILPIAELTLAAMIFLKYEIRVTLIITLLLFSIFFAFSIYGHVVGLSKDCGCFGIFVESDFGWIMIVRNLVFLLISATLSLGYKSFAK